MQTDISMRLESDDGRDGKSPKIASHNSVANLSLISRSGRLSHICADASKVTVQLFSRCN